MRQRQKAGELEPVRRSAGVQQPLENPLVARPQRTCDAVRLGSRVAHVGTGGEQQVYAILRPCYRRAVNRGTGCW
jgi:hypothetical protein